ncbi:MAG TPA: hypothetical protein VH500_12680 [Nitrososphaeraceae archaeon]
MDPSSGGELGLVVAKGGADVGTKLLCVTNGRYDDYNYNFYHSISNKNGMETCR